MLYAISGHDAGQRVSVTRNQPAGAIVLAESWIASGYTEVRITHGAQALTLDEFRARCDLTRDDLTFRPQAPAAD